MSEPAGVQTQTFEGEAEYWLLDARLRISQGHLKRVMAILRELSPVIGKLNPMKITADVLARYQQSEKAKGLTDATVNRKTEVVTTILNHSVKHRRIAHCPFSGFRKLKGKSPEMRYWTMKEAESFLEFTSLRYPSKSKMRWVYVSYLVALNTALRAGEIWGLKWLDCDFANSVIYVRRQFDRVTGSFGQTKGKRGRVVPCPKTLEDELLALRTESAKPDDTIFRNEMGQPVCHDNFAKRQFASDLRLWKGRQVRFHDLRHTATTLLIASGVDVRTVKDICGHADITTTMGYVHMLAGSVTRVAQTFVIEPGKGGAKSGLIRKIS